ncbi:MAG: alpha/beta hydrolase [Chitinophagaceae bacterium]
MKLGQKLAVNYIRARLNLLAVLSQKKAAQKAYAIFFTPFYRNKQAPPPIFSKAEQISIIVKGNTVRGFRWNAGGSKRVLVLHGFESSVKNFDAYITALINKNYEVLAFDAPGHGVSGGRQITLTLYIDTIAAIHFQVGIVQSFMAHSFGGLAVTQFIEKIPNQDIRLALIAPVTEAVTAIDSFFRFLQLNAGVRSEFEKLIHIKSGVPASYFSISRALENIQGKVLWVHDREDQTTPFRDVEPVMQKNYKHVSFLVTNGLGHKKIYRDNKVIQAVTDFL